MSGQGMLPLILAAMAGYAMHAVFPPGDFPRVWSTPHPTGHTLALAQEGGDLLPHRQGHHKGSCAIPDPPRDRSRHGSVLLQSSKTPVVSSTVSQAQAMSTQHNETLSEYMRAGKEAPLDHVVMPAINTSYVEQFSEWKLIGERAEAIAGARMMAKGVPTFTNSVTVVDHGEEGQEAYVAVPFYSHGKASLGGIGEYIGSDILGDALEPTGHEHGTHGYVALLFLFGCLALGCAILILLERVCPSMPYTCALFAAGFLVSIVHWFQPKDWITHWPSWFESVSMWDGINPHLIFYAFLPALIFGESMRVSVQLVEKCFWQVFLMACPAVILGTVCVASFCKNVLPYGWDWPISLVVGSILCATDPVAVVALFHTLGVSPRLTMLISGESMLNDGTAVVIFQLCLKVALGAQVTFTSVVMFFSWMTVVAVGFGVLTGNTAVVLIGWCAEEHYSNDCMIQVVITICCGYLTFFLAEHQIETSGVIATVTSGFTMAFWAWPRFVSRETMKIVWEAIEFIGNTLIFFLSGLIWGNIVLSRWGLIGIADIFWLGVLYVAIMAVRAAIMLIFWVPMNIVGTPLNWKEGVVMTWSGLRGAVSLALAIIVDIEPDIDQQRGSRVMFHVGGIAALTFLINSTSAASLLSALGMTKTTNLRQRMMQHIQAKLQAETQKEFEELVQSAEDFRFKGANEAIVRKMVPGLEDGSGSTRAEATFSPRKLNDALTELELQRIYREAFLCHVQNFYWQAIETGIVPRNVKVARVLLHSTDEAIDNSEQCLNDWDIISRDINMKPPGFFSKTMAKLADTWPFTWLPEMRRTFSKEFVTMRNVYGALCYKEAHKMAVKHVLGQDHTLLDNVELEDRARVQVKHESEIQCCKATDLLDQQKPDDVAIARSEMLARRLLTHQALKVHHLVEHGHIKHSEAADLEHKIYGAIRQIVNLPKDSWRDMLRVHTATDEGGEERRLSTGLGLFTAWPH